MRTLFNIPVRSFMLALLGTVLGHQICQASARSAPVGSSHDQEVFQDFGSVLGRGTSREEAREDAARQAQPKIDAFLQKKGLTLEEGPSLDFIRDQLLKGAGERLPDEDQPIAGVAVKCWKWFLVIERADWDQMLYRDQHARAERRMLGLGKFLAGLLGLLIVVVGYIRLDEWTKGYYTGWLRLAGGCFLALVAAGIWWLP